MISRPEPGTHFMQVGRSMWSDLPKGGKIFIISRETFTSNKINVDSDPMNIFYVEYVHNAHRERWSPSLSQFYDEFVCQRHFVR